MPYCTTQAVVLRRSHYRESDRVLTLLTPERGRVEATARGCRKIKSPLMAACELFTLGEYVLYQGKGHETLSSFTLGDSFYPLRQDVTRLSHASVMLACAEAAAQKEEPAAHLFILLTRSLTRLAYGETESELVTAAFLLHFSLIEGFKPRLNHCVACGRPLASDESGYLSPETGGLHCTACMQGLPGVLRLSAHQINWLRQVLVQGVDKTPPTHPPLPQLLRYVQHHIDRRLPEVLG